jgi:hypothetical protein
MALDPQSEKKVRERADRMFAEAEGDPHRLALLAAQFAHYAEGAKPDSIEISGGISSRDGSPYVSFRFGGDYAIQQKPEEARDLALTIIEAAETAVSDGALFSWLIADLFADAPDKMSKAANVVGIVRDFRRDRWGLSGEREVKGE